MVIFSLSFQVSYTFCKDFIAGLVKDMSATDFGRTSVLIKAFQRVSLIPHEHFQRGQCLFLLCPQESRARVCPESKPSYLASPGSVGDHNGRGESRWSD